MKKKIITLLLVIMLCSSSLFILSACGEGDQLTYSGQTVSYTQNLTIDLHDPDVKKAEILKGTNRGTFTLGDETGITFEAIYEAGYRVGDGFQLREVGTFEMTVFYKGQSCKVTYEVKAGS